MSLWNCGKNGRSGKVFSEKLHLNNKEPPTACKNINGIVF